MSILFPKVRMPRAYDYRPIYYDPKEDERKQKLARLQAARKEREAAEQGHVNEVNADYVPTLHRGSFKEAHDATRSFRAREERKSRLLFWVALLGILIVVFFVWM